MIYCIQTEVDIAKTCVRLSAYIVHNTALDFSQLRNIILPNVT